MASGIPLASSIPLSSTGAIVNPRFAVLRPKLLENAYVCCKDGRAVIDEEVGVFSPLVKIQVETAKKVESEKTFVHLRFCHSNRYMGHREGSEVPIAESKQPDEDTKKTTSTLFELLNGPGKPDKYYFRHVQSGTYPQLNAARDTLLIKEFLNIDELDFELVDWESLVKLPKHVAFKGDNGRYLRAYPYRNMAYLTFDSSDPNHEASAHEIELVRNGYVKIKCPHFSNRYWRNGENWIFADDESGPEITAERLLYWPVFHHDNTISLLSARNNLFCARLTADGKEDCLNAAAHTAVSSAKFVVQELVDDRKIYDVTYRMDDARIYGEQLFTAGRAIGLNNTDKDNQSVAVTCEYKDIRSYSFSRSTSITAGVNTKIEVSALEIVSDSIELSFQISEAFEWGESKTIEKTVTATGTVAVPARSRAILNYTGTIGTCNVPYSYKQEDRSSTDGKITTTQEDDGVFIGTNYYNFTFELLRYEPLPL